MSKIIAFSSPRYKPTRRTSRPDAPFGAGIAPPTHWAGSWGFISSHEDASWAAAEFNSDSPDGAELDRIGQERAWEDQYEASCAVGGHCRQCNRKDDFIDDSTGLCPPCQIALETAQEDSSQGSLYLAATGRRMVP